jgi:uncharacterized damage-inducible protein DinB
MLYRTLVLISALAAAAFAQNAVTQNAVTQNPVATSLKTLNDEAHRNLGEALGKAPEAMLDFRPVEGVMSFREIAGHLINTDNRLCSLVKGEAPPDTRDYQKEKVGLADLAAAWKKSGDYCSALLGSMTDADLGVVMKMGSREMSKASLVTRLVQHQGLHYGNLITYMRMKGMVPPETERSQQPRK